MGFLCLSCHIDVLSLPLILWKSFQKGLCTQVNRSTTFHPQTDRKAERTIQTLEDMLRPCVIYLKGRLDDHLPLIEFAYNKIATIPAFRWLLMKLYMGVYVDLLVGLK